MTFKLIVFDLDGTLVDSKRDLAEAANATLLEAGAPTLAEDAIGRMVGDGAPVLVARAFTAVGFPQPEGALQRFLSIYDKGLLKHTRPYDGIPELLTELEQDAVLAVLTNKPLEATNRILRGLNLLKHFQADRVMGGDGPVPRKPDPAGLRHLIEITNGSPETTLLVGDSIVDWRTARAASTKVCVARYGFGFEGFPVDQLSEEDWVLDSPHELRRYL